MNNLNDTTKGENLEVNNTNNETANENVAAEIGIQIENEMEKKIEDYRNQLLVFELEKAYISQRLDTAVADTSIRHYYERNKGQFKQSETLVRFILFKVF